MSKKVHKKASTAPSISQNAHSDNRINLSSTPNTNRVIVNVKWQPLKKYLESNNEKSLICRSKTSVSEEGNEEPPGSDDSHATVVQSVTEENERSPSSGSGGSKKSENGNDNVEDEGQAEEEDEAGHEEDEGIIDVNNDECTSDTKEDVIVVEDIEDDPEEVVEEELEGEQEEELSIPPPEPEEIEEIDEPPSEPDPELKPEIEIEEIEAPDEEEELPPPPPQFTSSKEVTSAPLIKETSDSAKTVMRDNNNATTTIDIEQIEPLINKCKDNDIDLNQELETTNTTTKISAPSTSSAPSITTNNNDSQIITVPIINEPEMSTKQDSPQKIQEKKPLPDISNTRRYDDDPDKIWNCGAWFEYILVVVVSSLLLLAATVLTLFWAIYYRQGFDLTDADKKFNLHPVLMIGGYITLSGFSIILYRICRCCSHLMVKLCHALFHALAIPCIVIGFLIVWDYKNQTGAAHFYSLHSWLGLITMGLFGLQFILGFFSFLILLCCDNATYKFRSVMVPIHAIFGIITFMLAIATALTGFLQKARFDLGSDYNLFAEEGIIVNTIGVVLIGLGCIVPFAVRRANSPANSRVYVTERL